MISANPVYGMKIAIRVAMQKSYHSPLRFKCAVVAMALLASLATVRAVPYTVGGNTYDVTVQELRWDNANHRSLLMLNPWWGNLQLSADVAGAVGGSLGVQTSWVNNGQGPFFVYDGQSWGSYFSSIWTGSGTTQTAGWGTEYVPLKFAVGSVVHNTPDSAATFALLGLSFVALVAFRRKFTA